MKLFLNILITCFVFLQSVTSISQNVTASVESDSTLIGKELIYTIDVSSDRVENIIFPDATSFVPFELISEHQIDTTEVEEGFLFSKKVFCLPRTYSKNVKLQNPSQTIEKHV